MKDDKKNPNELTLIFVINGEDVEVDANVNAPLKVARNKALTESGNTGRPFDDWETRDEAGTVLDPDQKVGTFDFEDGTRLFLNLAVGAGGCASRPK